MNEIDKILDFLRPDLKVLEEGKERQSKIWQNQEPDYLPIILSGTAPERDKFPRYNLKEQFYDKEKMLMEHLLGIIELCRGKSDGQLSVRANLGTGFVPTIFGMNQSVFEDKMPWIEEHLSKEEIRNLEFPCDVRKSGLVPMAVEYIKYFQEKLDGKVNIYLSDTQGPFDIAHLIRGEDIFTDVYDDPEFVHLLMELSTKAYIEVTKVLKEAIGEEPNSGYHNNMYMGDGGVRICEDSTTILSPSLAKEFAIPYTKKALEPFGGGYIHYCGNGNHILDFFLDIKKLKGINFGNPEMHDYTQVMGKLRERGKFYYGSWPKSADESMEDYFKRTLKPLGGVKKSLIFMPSGGSEKDWQTPDKAVSLWRSLQA